MDLSRAFDLKRATVLPRAVARLTGSAAEPLVHVRVTLDRRDQPGDAHRRILDFGGEAPHRTSCCRPAQHDWSEGPSTAAAIRFSASSVTAVSDSVAAMSDSIPWSSSQSEIASSRSACWMERARHAPAPACRRCERPDRGELRFTQARGAERECGLLRLIEQILELRRAALDGRRRVVQFVREPGGELSERRHLLIVQIARLELRARSTIVCTRMP